MQNLITYAKIERSKNKSEKPEASRIVVRKVGWTEGG